LFVNHADTLLFVLVTIRRRSDEICPHFKVSRMIKVDASLKKPAMLGAKGGLTAPQGPKGSFHWVLSVLKGYRLPTTNPQPRVWPL